MSHVDRGLFESQADGTLPGLKIEEFNGSHPGPDFLESPLQEGDPYHCYHKLTFVKKLSLHSHKGHWWERTLK